MEGEGLKRSVTKLEENGLEIVELVTDRHKSNAKWIAENMVGTRHYYDVWHIAKGTKIVINIHILHPELFLI